MPPKSQVFRRIERRILGPTMSGLGFDRPRDVGVGTWVRQHQDAWLVVWTQLSKWNYGDDPEGYRFTMEFQLGSQPSGGWDGRRTRYYRLLDPAQKQDHLAIYNRVIAKASPNPAFLSGMDANERARYLEDLRPRRDVPDRWDDPWLPYIDESDVEAWMAFLADALPAVVDRFLRSGDWRAGG